MATPTTRSRGGVRQPLFKSSDLRKWTFVGDFLSHDLPDVAIGEDISCPNFFPIGDKWMLLCISHPLGCRYYIGDWDAKAERFVPATHGRMNWKRDEQPVYGCLKRTDFFAPESVLTADGRRVMWAWLTSPGPDNALVNRTIQSLPRELSLPSDGILRIKPLRELEAQRYDPIVVEDIVIADPISDHCNPVPPKQAPKLQRIAELPGDSCELRIVIPRAQALRKLLGIVLFADGKGGGLPIMLRPETGTIRVGTTDAPFAAADLPEDEDVELRVFVDRYLVEVFANSRQAVVAAPMDYAGNTGLDAFTVGATTKLTRLELWKLKPTHQGFLEAQRTRTWEPDPR